MDFTQAFDRISHEYLYTILPQFGFTQWFIERLKALYDGAEAAVQINGEIAGSVSIQCGVRQGCPLSMALFTICLHPLLQSLQNALPKIRTTGKTQQNPVLAYADDLLIFITQRSDFEVVERIIRTYEKASGAKMNPMKSKALPVGRWDIPPAILGINLQTQVRILWVDFAATTQHTTTTNWDRITNVVRIQASKTYHRCLDFSQRAVYIQTFLLAKIWYIAQCLPISKQHAQRLTTICMWHLWQGAMFWVPVSPNMTEDGISRTYRANA
jgi:hypothetical protein